nr:MAG TPA: chromosome partition protein [Bacteriophage sp.]
MHPNLKIYEDKQDKLTKQCIYMQGLVDSAKQNLNNTLAHLNQLKLDLDLTDIVNQYFTNQIKERIQTAQHQIEDIINQGLTFIYRDDSIKVTVDTEVKANKLNFIINVSDPKITSSNLEETFGGGVLATIAFLLKIITNILYKNENLMIFDESLTFVSKHYQENLSAFIKKLCNDLDLTLILISHQPLLHSQADIVYEAYKDNNETKFNRVDSL